MIVGAGDAGALVVREMQKNPELQMNPVCFLDDNPEKQNQQIHGVPVVGTLDDLRRITTTRRIDEVTVAIPSASGYVIRQVADACRQANIPFRTMPGIYRINRRESERQPLAGSRDHRFTPPPTSQH